MNAPRLRRLLLILTLGAIAALFVLPFNPVNNTLSKLTYLAAIFTAFTGSLLLLWRFPRLRFLPILFAGLVSLPFLLPGRPLEQNTLRQAYIDELRNFEGCLYYWGGESRFGIDCSGLPRRSLINALIRQSIPGFNASALRHAVGLWWYDASAKAISEGYRDETIPLGNDGKLRELDLAKLSTGDLAVTQGGAHMLVYLGDGNWIQADPGVGKVITENSLRDSNPWFSYRVTTHRWRVFEGL